MQDQLLSGLHGKQTCMDRKKMQIEIALPDDVARNLTAKWGNLERQILEIVVVQAYQDGVISAGKVRKLQCSPNANNRCNSTDQLAAFWCSDLFVRFLCAIAHFGGKKAL
jgi:hypothetical protein